MGPRLSRPACHDSVIPVTDEAQLPNKKTARLVQMSTDSNTLNKTWLWSCFRTNEFDGVKGKLDRLGRLQSELYPSIVGAYDIRNFKVLLGDPLNPIPRVVVAFLEGAIEVAQKKVRKKLAKGFTINSVASPLPPPQKTKHEIEEERDKKAKDERAAMLARMSEADVQAYLKQQEADLQSHNKPDHVDEFRRLQRKIGLDGTALITTRQCGGMTAPLVERHYDRNVAY